MRRRARIRRSIRYGSGSEQFEGSAGFEVFGDAVAEGVCGDAGGSVGGDADHAFAVGREHLGVDVPGDGCVVIGDGGAVDADGDLTAAAEGVENGALDLDGEARFRVVEGGYGGADVVVAVGFLEDCVAGGAGFEREGSLSGGGAEFVDGKALVDPFGAVEAVEAGGGKDEGVACAFGQLAQASVYVAADFYELEVGAEGQELGLAAGAGGAYAASQGQGVEGPVFLADPGVAGIDSGRDGGEGEARVEFGGEVLERVDGEVDAAFGQGFFDFLDEDALAAGQGREGFGGGFREFGLLHAVAGGADDFDLDGVAGVAECGGDVVCLPESELGASGANADGFSHGLLSRIRHELQVVSLQVAGRGVWPPSPGVLFVGKV
jgi:hypothetical protein